MGLGTYKLIDDITDSLHADCLALLFSQSIQEPAKQVQVEKRAKAQPKLVEQYMRGKIRILFGQKIRVVLQRVKQW